ncbi:MAG: ABC transporter ATP-binding protein [Patescibacteria group bacterium]|jgi:putative ABC transport system ATP-binding protein
MAYLSVKNLTKKFHLGGETITALDDVSFDVQQGEFLSVTGQSGSGKSTLMHILGALEIPTTGTYALDGEDISGKSLSSLVHVRRHSIGFVFQTFNLLPRLSAAENVALPLIYQGIGLVERRHRAQEALKRVDLENRMKHKPNELSGGERQRVAVARALVTNPKIVLADEPTGNLDSKTSAEIMKLLLQLKDQGTTIILVTHESDLARLADRVLELHDGKVASITSGGAK